MLLARISFVPQMDHEEAELVATAQQFLIAVLKNGQIQGDYVTGWREGVFEAFVSASHRECLQFRHNSKWGNKALAAVKLQFGVEPACEILDDNISLPVPTLKSATSLYLYCDGLTHDSVVRHGNKGTPMPLPLLPVDDDLREDLFLWHTSYGCADRAWFDGGPLELAAYQQLADPDSELMTDGQAICRRLEKAVSKPVFLYLLRHWGHNEGENARLCPRCGNSWQAVDSPTPSREPFYRFHFQCDECRLVSHEAVAHHDEQLAAIGTFTPSQVLELQDAACVDQTPLSEDNTKL